MMRICKVGLCVSFATFAFMVSFADTEVVGGYAWTYRINGDTAEIYGSFYGSYDDYDDYSCSYAPAVYPEPTGVVTIPSYLGGKPVTSIGDYAFYQCSGLTSMTIPDSVTSIGYEAFYACSGLTSVTIPDSVTSIGSEAFSGCSGLTSVTMPDSVTSIGYSAFSGCSGLTSVTIPDSVTGIGWGAFSGCSGLTSVTIPDSVTWIGDDAFFGCSGLTSVTIPDSVTSIGESAFGYCSGLKSFIVGSGNPDYKSVNGLLLSKDGKDLIHGLNGDVAIPEGVLDIWPYAFSGCSGLTSVTIPASVTNIYYAFYQCSGLTSVTIPDSVTSIGDYEFYGCSGLKSVTIPDSVTWIGDGAFYGCSGLKSVTIPDGVTSIGSYAFYGCDGLTSIALGNSVVSIGIRAFSGCRRLASVVIPDSVTDIMDEAFAGCSGIASVTIGNGVMNIGNSAFYNCSGLKSMTIPDSVTWIGDSAFFGCSGLTDVTIPDSVTSIGDYAFRGCSGLTSVTIPDSVTSIGSDAFFGCSGLTSVTIPDSVTSIGFSAFYGCSGLKSVTIPASVTNIESIAFAFCGGMKSYIVASDNPNYKSTDGLLLSKDGKNLVQGVNLNGDVTIPDGVESIGDYAFAECCGLTSVTIPDSVTNIGYCAFNSCTGLTRVTIGSGLASSVVGSDQDGDGVFSGCSNLRSFIVSSRNSYYKSVRGLLLSKDGKTLIQGVNGDVVVPDGVTSIGDDAFSDCSGLTSVTIPDSVTSIGFSAFSGCSSLKSVTIGSGLASVGAGSFYPYRGSAFAGCCSLMSFAVSNANPNYKSLKGLLMTKDGKVLVHGVNGDVAIPGSVTSIGTCAFSGCSGLKSVTIPDSVTGIGWGAFSGCSGLKSVTIPDSVTSIGSDAFFGCSGLTSVTIPDGVTSIGESAFGYCSGLKSFIVGSGNPDYKSVNGLLLSKDGKDLIHGLNGDVAIPEGVLDIWPYAFCGYGGLKSVTIPDSVVYIGRLAFSDCSGLTSVTIPDSVEVIDSYAFFGCRGLQCITIHSETGIYNWAFEMAVPKVYVANGDVWGEMEMLQDSMHDLRGIVIVGGVAPWGEQEKPASVLACEDAFEGAGTVTLDDDGNIVVTLTSDVSGTVGIPDNVGSVTIDLNGHDMVGDDGPAIRIVAGDGEGGATRLAIVDTSEGGKGQISGGGESAGIEVAEDAAPSVRFDVEEGVGVFNGDGSEQPWWELCPVEATLVAGKYFKATLVELGYDVPTNGTPYSVVAKGLPAGLKLKYNAAVTKKVKKGKTTKTVVVKPAKVEWWIEGVPTAAVDFFTNPPYLVITANGVTTTEPLPVEVLAQDVTELEDLALGQTLNEQYYLPGVTNGWTVSGLPTGLKYTAKLLTTSKKVGKKTVVTTNALPYSVYGKTTKAGLFTITAKKKVGAYYETKKYRVLVTPKAVDAMVFGEELANITTMAYVPVSWDLTNDVAAVGGKVAKVTGLPGGIVFAAKDTYAYSNPKKKTGKYLKQAGQTIVGTPTKPGTYVVTFTKNVTTGTGKNKKTVAKTAQILWTVTANDANLELGFNIAGGVIEGGTVGLKYGDLMAFDATEGATVTASGMPAGITLANLGGGSYAFTGFTTKAGTYLVTVKATLKGKTVAQRVALKVDGLPSWAKGTFNGYIAGVDGATNGLATITVSSVGKISGKFYEGGTNWTFTAASYTGYDNAVPAYSVPVVAKYAYKATEIVKGKKKTVTKSVARNFTLRVGQDALGGMATLEEVDGSAVNAWQNLWGSTYKALGARLFYTSKKKPYRVFTINAASDVGAEMGLTDAMSLSLKVTPTGAVTATMSFDTGKTSKGKAVIYKPTCSTVVIPLSAADAEEFEGEVFLFFAPSPANNFPGFAGAAPF